MSKIAVIYKSKYGSTKKYAQWITNELNADLFQYTQINTEKLLEYDTVILGVGLYAGVIKGIEPITKNFEALKNKNIIIFTVGIASTDDKKIFKPTIEKNFTEEMRKKIQFFHMRGGMDYKKLGFLDKYMMRMLKKMISKKKTEELSEDEKIILDIQGNVLDFTDIKTIDPLVSYVTKHTKINI